MPQDVQRAGRFQNNDAGGAFQQGYRDVVKDDTFDNKFLRRNYGQYDVLKKAGLHKKGGLKKLKGLSDTQLEGIAAKSVLKDQKYKPKKLPTKYNTKKHNIKWAKSVMKRRAAGQTVKKQALIKTKQARAHIRRVNRNRRIMKTRVWKNVPKGF